MIRMMLVALAFALAVLVAGGCGGGGGVSLNTTCGDFLTKSSDDQAKLYQAWSKQVNEGQDSSAFDSAFDLGSFITTCASEPSTKLKDVKP